MTTATVQCERPASYELLTHDHPATDRAMTQDYNSLPEPWQWLKDAKPEPGQICEWVALSPWGADSGKGKWIEINSDVNPDPRFWAAPGCGQVTISGFEGEKGVAVYDPTFTTWKTIPTQITQP